VPPPVPAPPPRPTGFTGVMGTKTPGVPTVGGRFPAGGWVCAGGVGSAVGVTGGISSAGEPGVRTGGANGAGPAGELNDVLAVARLVGTM
jgi:hypothetical protein